jgi:peptidoglycan/LPS O-acetylase OafA/YrhL
VNTNKTFFSGLNELRALAALMVVLHHIEFFKFRDNIPCSITGGQFSYLINNLGHNSVNLFFVISGFLITTILLEEKEKSNKINLKKFYLRRALRIWPLYFLILIVAFLFIPYVTKNVSEFTLTSFYYGKITDVKNYNFKSILMYFTFLSNLALIWHNKFVAAASQTWSVSIEEQFYIIWPLFIIVFNKKTMIILLFLFILFYFLIFYSSNNLLALIKYVFMFQNIFWGALGAYFYNLFPRIIKKVSSNTLLFIMILFSTFLLLSAQVLSVNIQNNIISILFLFILFFTINDDNILSFRSEFISKLGVISYGIYMFHPLVMYFVFPFANKYFLSNLIIYNIVVYILVFSLTIMISHFSYKYFESYFLRIKEKKFN